LVSDRVLAIFNGELFLLLLALRSFKFSPFSIFEQSAKPLSWILLEGCPRIIRHMHLY
jgi:hypothetical protein